MVLFVKKYSKKAICTLLALLFIAGSALSLTIPVFSAGTPAVPQNVSATPVSYKSIQIKWSAISTATGYVVYSYNITTKASTRLAVTKTTSYTNTGLVSGRTYYYKARAYTSAGGKNIYGNPSATVSAKLLNPAAIGPFTADHKAAANFSTIPQSYIKAAKNILHIAYGHASHGSQVITGMDALAKNNSLYGGLHLNDNPFESYNAYDLGNPDRTTWAAATRQYLKEHPSTNVVIWSWCGEVDGTKAEIQTYLNLMNQLEKDYPGVKFVYMTGHLDGSGENGNVNIRNNQIRAFCKTNHKILYDFADIESFEPGGVTNFMKLGADDGCNYSGGNWAANWVAAHPTSHLTALANRCDECQHTE